MYVCICNGITDHQIREAAAAGCSTVAELTMRTGAGANCGSCLDMAKGREGDLRLNHGPDLDWSIQQLAAKMKPKPKRKPRSPKP